MGCGWCRWWKLWAVGEEGGIQAAWWLGGDEAQKGLKLAGGEQATAVMGLLLFCKPSEARSLENMASASGKLGGVAGVLLGVHICIWWWWWLLGMLVSWKNVLRAVSNCQWAACSSCFAWSAAQPAASTNWLIMTWCLSSSMFTDMAPLPRCPLPPAAALLRLTRPPLASRLRLIQIFTVRL